CTSPCAAGQRKRCAHIAAHTRTAERHRLTRTGACRDREAAVVWSLCRSTLRKRDRLTGGVGCDRLCNRRRGRVVSITRLVCDHRTCSRAAGHRVGCTHVAAGPGTCKGHRVPTSTPRRRQRETAVVDCARRSVGG